MLQVVELGSHPQLVEAGGLYAEMWRRQQESSVVEKPSSSAATSRSASYTTLAQHAQQA